jgi:hypothetical protein
VIWIVISLGLLALGGLALFVRLILLRRHTKVALVVMGVALLISVACALLIHSMTTAGHAG